MASGLVERVDAWAGQRIEARIGRHHRRRLRGVGRIDQLDPPHGPVLWAAGDPPPRPGGAFEVLVDGGQALPRIADALIGARSYVHIAGWHITPHFGLTRDERASRLRDLLGDLAERVEVRVLLWAGAPVRVFTPARAAVRRVREELIRGYARAVRARFSRAADALPLREAVIVDGEVAFVGGVDLTSLGGDRFDTGTRVRKLSGRLPVRLAFDTKSVTFTYAPFTNNQLGAPMAYGPLTGYVVLAPAGSSNKQPVVKLNGRVNSTAQAKASVRRPEPQGRHA